MTTPRGQIAPRATRIFETCLYASDVLDAAAFYEQVFGLEIVTGFAPRGIALRCGASALLILIPPRLARTPASFRRTAPPARATWHFSPLTTSSLRGARSSQAARSPSNGKCIGRKAVRRCTYAIRPETSSNWRRQLSGADSGSDSVWPLHQLRAAMLRLSTHRTVGPSGVLARDERRVGENTGEGPSILPLARRTQPGRC